jgi:hypothetical protein
MNTYIGIDNGPSGTIGVITPHQTYFFKTPVFRELDFQKTKAKYLNRFDGYVCHRALTACEMTGRKLCCMERPFSNGKAYNASTIALRCWEAQLIMLKQMGIPRTTVDSKPWQAMLLPAGVKGSKQLKEASKHVGMRLFPEHEELIKRHGDADGILIAEWARRENL